MPDTDFVVTTEGDSVDLIAFRRYGTHGMEQAIFDMNPGLAAHGPMLPLGIRVALPTVEIKDRAETQRAWGK